jgi:hypothetical protein
MQICACFYFFPISLLLFSHSVMRQRILLLLLLAGWGARAQTLLQQQSFETTETVNYTASTVASASSTNIYFYNATLPVPGFNAGVGQVSTVTNINGVATNSTGTHFWASENVRRDASGNIRGNPAANVTLNPLNVAGKSNLSVTVALADASGLPGNTGIRWETDDFVRVQYRFNGVGGWTTIGQFVGDGTNGGGPPPSGGLRQDYYPCDGIANAGAPVLNQTLTDYNFTIPGSGNTLEVRVEVDQDGASEEFGFDNIRVYGSSAVGNPPVLSNIESTAVAFAEGGSPVALTSSLTVSDPDNTGLASGTVSISAGFNSSEDRLSFVGDATTGNITATAFNTGTGVLALTSAGATATPTQWQNAFRRVFYQNIDIIDAKAGTRTVSFAATDPNNNISGAVQRNITVTSALDAASGLPYLDTFETDGEGTRYASNQYFSQNAARFQRISANPTSTTADGTTFSNIGGSFYWVGVNTALTSQNPTGLNNGTLVTKQVNTAGYTNLQFQLRIGASASINNGNLANWRTTDYFQLSYRPSGSSTWTPFGLFRGTTTANSGGVIRQDSNPTGTGVPTGTQLTPALQNFVFFLPSSLNGQTVDFQLVVSNLDGVNYLAFDQLQVTGTQLVLPSVTTAAATSITTTSAVLGGNVTNDGGAPVTARGIRYGTSSTLSGATQVANGTGVGTYSATISGLSPGTTYYVAAYAINTVGTTQGTILSFTTAAPTITLSPASPLPGTTVGTAYSQTLTASGGTAPYTFAITAGALPAGLTLTSAGALAGTPTAGGTFNFTVRATDASTGAYSGTQSYALTVAPPTIAVAPATLPIGTQAVAYSQTLAASGGTAPYAFAVTSGALPAGLTLAANGTLSGTPTATGSFTFTVTATDASTGSGPYSGPRSYTLVITAPALTVVVSSTAGTSGSTTATAPIPFAVSFSQSVGTTFVASDVTVSGGTLTSGSFAGSGAGPYSFTVTPSASGTVSVSLAANVAQDANGTQNTASNLYSLVYQQAATAAPVLTAPANSSTVSGLPTFAGTAPAGSTVTVYLIPNGGTAQSIGTTTATGGSFSLTPATALASGTYSAYATAQASGAAVSATSNTNTFTVDATAPVVVASNRQSPAASLTNATTLTYRLTFSEAVTGVSAGDFGLTSTGTASGTISAVAAVSTSVYDVTVTGASGDGTLRLDLNSTGTGIADAVGNALSGGYTGGQAYTLDTTAPVATISTTATNPTSTSPIPFTVTFSEAVTGFSVSSITATNGTISGFTSAGNAYSFSVTPTANGAVSVSVAANVAQDAAGNGNAAATPLSVTYAAPVTLTAWTGAISTDWYTAGNWTAGVPTSTIDATISTVSGGRYPLVAAGTATTRNLTINSGASLNQSGGTIAIAANLTNNGTFLPTGGTVNLGTTSLSSVLGSSNIRFWNLTVGTNGAQLSTSIGASVQRLLTLNGGFATNGNSFVLESNNTLTALVVNNSGNVVSGTVTVQRAIDPSVNSGLGYRHYSAPVSNSTVGDLTTSGFTPVVNPAFNTVVSPYTITPYPTVYGYDDSRLSLNNNLDMFDKGYFSPSALSDPLAVGKGYTVNIAASEVVDFQGTLNNGDLSLNLTSNRNAYPEGGWQFLGNPYPAPLDYSRIAVADRAGLDAAIYIYSSTSQYGGRYRTYVNGIGNPVLPIGQGFFARVAASQTSATLIFRNSQRLTVPSGTTMQRTTADPRPLVQLTLQGSTSALLDEAYVYFENGAGSGFEPEFDAEKLPNPTGLNLSTSLANGHQLSIDGQPELGTSQRVVPLAVGVPAAGVYTFTASQLLNLGATPVYLRDLQTGTLTDLRQQPSYQFTVSNAAALNTTRFELVFSPRQVLATVPAALADQVALYPNPAQTQVAIELPLSLSRQPVTAALLDALGRMVRQQVLPAGGATHLMPLADLATGVYSLRLTTETGTVVKKLVVE